MSWMCESAFPQRMLIKCSCCILLCTVFTQGGRSTQSTSSHSSFSFPKTQEPQQIAIHAKLLVVKVPFRGFFKLSFSSNYYLIKTLLF